MTPKIPIMHAGPARITDTTRVKHTVFAFRHCPNVDLPRPQSPVKHSVFEHLARRSQRNSGGDPAAQHRPAPGRTSDPLQKTSGKQIVGSNWLVAIGW